MEWAKEWGVLWVCFQGRSVLTHCCLLCSLLLWDNTCKQNQSPPHSLLKIYYPKAHEQEQSSCQWQQGTVSFLAFSSLSNYLFPPFTASIIHRRWRSSLKLGSSKAGGSGPCCKCWRAYRKAALMMELIRTSEGLGSAWWLCDTTHLLYPSG